MATIAPKPLPEKLDPAEVRQELENILKSKYFVNAHKKKGFLRLICDYYLDGRAGELNEYMLGFEVFGRDNKYNPGNDPIVRVVAHEVRKKLELYYQNEGASDQLRLEIPAGSYQPIFTRVQVEPVVEPAEVIRSDSELINLQSHNASTLPIYEPTIDRRRTIRARTLGLWLVFLALTIAVVALAFSNRELRSKITASESYHDTSHLGFLWASFFKDQSPPLVILSNPPVLRLANASDPDVSGKDIIPFTPKTIDALKERFVINPEISVKEPESSETGDANSSNEKVVIKQSQTPRLIISTNSHTGLGEAIGLHYLTDFFRLAGRGILLKQSRTMSAEDLRNHNVIFLGGAWANQWSGKLAVSEDFIFSANATIVNKNPQSGEEHVYIPQFDGRTGNLMIDYALVTLKPNLSDANEVMVLAGVYSQGTEAATEYVTNSEYLTQLNQRLLQLNSPRYFQALIRVGVENGIPTTISLISVHELKPLGN